MKVLLITSSSRRGKRPGRPTGGPPACHEERDPGAKASFFLSGGRAADRFRRKRATPPSSPKRVTQLLHEGGAETGVARGPPGRGLRRASPAGPAPHRRERAGHTLHAPPWFTSFLRVRRRRRALAGPGRLLLGGGPPDAPDPRRSRRRPRPRQARRNARRLTLDEAMAAPSRHVLELLEIDEALGRLAEEDPRKSRVVELHFFGGLDLRGDRGALGRLLPPRRQGLAAEGVTAKDRRRRRRPSRAKTAEGTLRARVRGVPFRPIGCSTTSSCGSTRRRPGIEIKFEECW